MNKTDAIAFFCENAGYCCEHGESHEQGKLRCAVALAEAEEWFFSVDGGQVDWQVNYDSDRSWMEDGIDDRGEPLDDGRILWGCVVSIPSARKNREIVSLWGIDLGHNSPDEDPYARVVVAELALELRGRVS